MEINRCGNEGGKCLSFFLLPEKSKLKIFLLPSSLLLNFLSASILRKTFLPRLSRETKKKRKLKVFSLSSLACWSVSYLWNKFFCPRSKSFSCYYGSVCYMLWCLSKLFFVIFVHFWCSRIFAFNGVYLNVEMKPDVFLFGFLSFFVEFSVQIVGFHDFTFYCGEFIKCLSTPFTHKVLKTL